jgi:hypothetical protein
MSQRESKIAWHCFMDVLGIKNFIHHPEIMAAADGSDE